MSRGVGGVRLRERATGPGLDSACGAVVPPR